MAVIDNPVDYNKIKDALADTCFVFTGLCVKVEIYCKNNHLNVITAEDLYKPQELCCYECVRIEKQKELEKEHGYIIGKIERDEDITLEEFKNLLKFRDLPFRYKINHASKRCVISIMHAHHKRKCFYREKRICIESRQDIEKITDWHEVRDDLCSWACFYGGYNDADIDIEPVYLKDLIQK